MTRARDLVDQAGGIVVRREGGRWMVLLVRAKKDPTVWIFPKGHLEPGESLEATAIRETREEAGVDGELVGPVGEPLVFQSGRERVRVQYFIIRATSDAAGGEGRPSQWFNIDEAVEQIPFPDARRLLRKVKARLDEPGPGRPGLHTGG